ncbi:hypothetical protein [Sagittula salina]|nr:hypothetical protein [Sagittula salina]
MEDKLRSDKKSVSPAFSRRHPLCGSHSLLFLVDKREKLIGFEYRQLLLCVDGDSGLAHIANMLFANDVISGKTHVADVRFTKGLGNRKRVTLTNEGEALRQLDVSAHQKLMDTAGSTYGLETDMTRLVAARLLAKYGASYSTKEGKTSQTMVTSGNTIGRRNQNRSSDF